MKLRKQVFIINGSGGVGKDTFVSYVKEYLDSKTRFHPAVLNYSSVDKVKTIAREIGWNGKKTEKDRKFLSDLKQLTTEYNDMPFHSMENMVHYFRNKTTLAQLLFLHIREPDEIERAKNEFHAKTILITRDSVSHITSNMADANVFDYEYDFVIKNNGTLDDLKKEAVIFIQNIKEGD
jgi:hypothetical protein